MNHYIMNKLIIELLNFSNVSFTHAVVWMNMANMNELMTKMNEPMTKMNEPMTTMNELMTKMNELMTKMYEQRWMN